MPRLLGQVILGVLLLVQLGPLCACAVGHTLLCGGPHDSPVPPGEMLPGPVDSCGDPRCGASCAQCPRHHRGAGCSRADSSNPSQKSVGAADLPAVPLFTAPPAADSILERQVPHKNPPDPSPGSRRSLPLLN